MRDLKSHTRFLLGLYKSLMYGDMVRHYGNLRSFSKDFETLEVRTRNEGLSFLTKTLPQIGKRIDNALVTGLLTHTSSSLKDAKGCAYPAFLQVLLSRVFEKDGSVKAEPCITAVKDLRQLLYLAYKYEVPYGKNVEATAINNFCRVNSSCPENFQESDEETRQVLRVARTLLRDLFQDFDPTEGFVPGHGPGSVATGESNWEKMQFKRLYDSVHQVYPYYSYFVANAMDLASRVSWYKGLERLPSGTSKVVLVPKDSRGPRTISMEPLEIQYAQQGLKRLLYPFIERHKLTRGHVNFTDQNINRELARVGSYPRKCVTLDMKEASDRVSLALVRELFCETKLLRYLEGLRTTNTELPDGTVVPLRLFAPMGSALCFPIMSVVHWSLAVAALNVRDLLPVEQARRAVYVYGDDIVIKGENHEALIAVFPKVGLLFNEGKCCTTGIFRESCGMDAMLGEDVTPLKLKKLFPSSPYDAVGYVSYIEASNRLFADTYYAGSSYIDKELAQIYGPIPYVDDVSSCPGLTTSRAPNGNNHEVFRFRYNANLQRGEIRVRHVVDKKHYVDLNRSEYHRKLMIHSSEFVAGVYSVPRRVKLKMGWAAAA
jgi:hypothetical protein